MALITPANLRTNFPEFDSTSVYPDAQVQFWLDFAYIMVNAQRWGVALPMGIQLFAAHNLVLGGQAVRAATVGGFPGGQVGPVSSKSVGPGSMSYDVGVGVEDKAGHWNLTTYGTRFINMARMMGAGPIEAGNVGWPGYGAYLPFA